MTTTAADELDALVAWLRTELACRLDRVREVRPAAPIDALLGDAPAPAATPDSSANSSEPSA